MPDLKDNWSEVSQFVQMRTVATGVANFTPFSEGVSLYLQVLYVGCHPSSIIDVEILYRISGCSPTRSE
jgi:hypothetical protein